jgi:hypothetical protein
MTCTRISGPGFDVFLCGPKPTCFSCGRAARAKCSFEGCDRPLCEDHLRKVGGDPRCAKHAPMPVNESMPRPPRRIAQEDDE